MDRTIFETATEKGTFAEYSADTPNFHQLLASGSPLPLHDYFWWRYDARRAPDRFNIWGDSFYNCINAGYQVNPFTGSHNPCASIDEMFGIVGNKLLDKVRNVSIDGGVALGEFHETCSFVQSAMVKTARSYRALKRGDLSKALHILNTLPNDRVSDIVKTSSDLWLSYTYGLRPLLKDVSDLVTTLDRRHRVNPLVKSARYSKTFFVKLNGVKESGFPFFYQNCVGSCRVRGSVKYRVTNPSIKSLDEWGFTNPLSIAWELVPFSFVVDWFIPIGDYLTNILPPLGVTFEEGFISLQASGSTTWVLTSLDDGIDRPGSSIERVKLRRILTSFPRYYFKVPDLSISKGNVISGLALLAQQVVR